MISRRKTFSLFLLRNVSAISNSIPQYSVHPPNLHRIFSLVSLSNISLSRFRRIAFLYFSTVVGKRFLSMIERHISCHSQNSRPHSSSSWYSKPSSFRPPHTSSSVSDREKTSSTSLVFSSLLFEFFSIFECFEVVIETCIVFRIDRSVHKRCVEKV